MTPLRLQLQTETKCTKALFRVNVQILRSYFRSGDEEKYFSDAIVCLFLFSLSFRGYFRRAERCLLGNRWLWRRATTPQHATVTEGGLLLDYFKRSSFHLSDN